MKVVVRLSVLVVLAWSLTVPVAFGWGDTGHQMIARIAAERLTLAARRAIVKLV
jgi:hypothetical protein